MQNTELAEMYERDLRRLIDEITAFKEETNLWKTQGTVINTAGNLALHIAGGLNHHLGATLFKNGYVRDRDAEFGKKGVPRAEIITQLEALIPMICNGINGLSPQDMEVDFPKFFDKPNASVSYVLTQLLLHLNYHLGQVNYLRRILE